MEFKHIKDTKCPFCGLDVKTATYSGTHCNGQQMEDVQYWCGYHVKWIPNFSKMEVIRLCPNSKENKKKKEQNDKLLDELKEFLRSKALNEFLVIKIVEEVRNALMCNP